MDTTLNIDTSRSHDSQLPTPQEGVESRPQGTAMPRRTFLKFGVSGLALSMVHLQENRVALPLAGRARRLPRLTLIVRFEEGIKRDAFLTAQVSSGLEKCQCQTEATGPHCRRK
jgi:hypothetical protein